MANSKITSNWEDYLECIYNHIAATQRVKAIDISRDLCVSRATVTETLKKLAEKGLINYCSYGVISLTSEGDKIAREVIRKHQILSRFFEDILGVSREEAQKNACRIEHVISEEAFERLIAFTDFCEQHAQAFKKNYAKAQKKNYNQPD